MLFEYRRFSNKQLISNMSGADGKDIVNLYFETVSLTIKKNLAIFESQKPHKRKKKLRKNLIDRIMLIKIDYM